jgi:hypothetical protein
MKKREKEEKVERARRQAEQRRLEDDMSAAATIWYGHIIDAFRYRTRES